MAGVLRAERVWVEAFTGPRGEQFGRLLKACGNAAVTVADGGCRWPSGCCWWRPPIARTWPCGNSRRCSPISPATVVPLQHHRRPPAHLL